MSPQSGAVAVPLEQQLAEAEATIAALRSAQQRLRDALRDSEDNFNRLADNVTDVFWARSPDMREVYFVSQGFDRIWGVPAATLKANPHIWIDFVHPEDRDRVAASFDSLKADAASIDIEYRILRPAGDVRWVRSRGFQARDTANRLVRLTGIVSDITDRKHAELSLRESE